MAQLLLSLSTLPAMVWGAAGSFGAYPQHGGNAMKQQIALSSNINESNVHSLHSLCTFGRQGSWGYIGYPLVDSDNNTVFADTAGYQSVDMSTCTLNWEVSNGDLDAMIGVAAGSSFPSLNTPALIETESGDRAVLFGYHLLKEAGNAATGCFIAALRVEDGSLLYSATILDSEHRDCSVCRIHGVMVDGQYAYGGTSDHVDYGYGSNEWLNATSDEMDSAQLWRGKVFKMDINNGVRSTSTCTCTSTSTHSPCRLYPVRLSIMTIILGIDP